MALSSPQRSHSAPQPLTAYAASSSISTFGSTTTKASAVPHLGALNESPPASPHPEIPDAFNLDGGFFPRSNSYFALNEMNKKPERQRTWVYGHDDHFSPASQHLSLRADDAGSRSGVSSPLTTGFSQPTTPGPSLGILSPADDDHDIQKELESQDVVGGLAYTAFAAAAKVGTPAFDGPSYDHDNLFHSYETLHSTFSAKRRSATVPNLASYAPKPSSRGGMYGDAEAPKKDAKVSFLFSPHEEKVDLFALMNDPDLKDGDERSVQEGDSWASFIYESAKRLCVRKSEAI